MKIVVTGGTGFIGRALVNELSAHGHEMVVLTRNPHEGSTPLVRFRQWDAVSAGAWQDEVSSADAVVNLAGEPIAEGRWTASRKRLLIESRVQATRRVVDALGARSASPPILISGSGIGY